MVNFIVTPANFASYWSSINATSEKFAILLSRAKFVTQAKLPSQAAKVACHFGKVCHYGKFWIRAKLPLRQNMSPCIQNVATMGKLAQSNNCFELWILLAHMALDFPSWQIFIPAKFCRSGLSHFNKCYPSGVLCPGGISRHWNLVAYLADFPYWQTLPRQQLWALLQDLFEGKFLPGGKCCHMADFNMKQISPKSQIFPKRANLAWQGKFCLSEKITRVSNSNRLASSDQAVHGEVWWHDQIFAVVKKKNVALVAVSCSANFLLIAILTHLPA